MGEALQVYQTHRRLPTAVIGGVVVDPRGCSVCDWASRERAAILAG